MVIAFVFLFVPTSVLAQESQNCPSGSYHGLDNAGNDACRDIETNKVVKILPKSSTTSNSSSEKNPFSIFFKFIENIFKGFSSAPIEKSVSIIENSVETITDSVETITDSVPVNLEYLSEKT